LVLTQISVISENNVDFIPALQKRLVSIWKQSVPLRANSPGPFHEIAHIFMRERGSAQKYL
jgi:hypothetical protein